MVARGGDADVWPAEAGRVRCRRGFRLAHITTDREDANAPKEFLKAALIAHYASMGEENSADLREIEEALNIWVRRTAESRLGLKRSDDYFGFVDDLIYLSEHYVRFKRALSEPYVKDQLEAIYYNAVNGLTNQLHVVLAAVRPRDTATDAKRKARLVANYLDRLYVSRMLSDEPLGARDFEPEYKRMIALLRGCETEQQVAEALASALPAEDFEAIFNFRLRATTKLRSDTCSPASRPTSKWAARVGGRRFKSCRRYVDEALTSRNAGQGLVLVEVRKR